MTLFIPSISLIVPGIVLTVWIWTAPEHDDWDDEDDGKGSV